MKNSNVKQNRKTQNIIKIDDVAIFLGISTATVRNWVKTGNIQTISRNNHHFNYDDIKILKENIENGSIKKLNGRANKSKNKKTFIPNEYLESEQDFNIAHKIVSFIQKNKLDIETAIFLLTLNLLKKENILTQIKIQDVITSRDIISNNEQINKELKAWQEEITVEKVKEEYSFLIKCELPKQNDILGFIYQSLLAEGKKSKTGSYYTPSHIVSEIVNEYLQKDSKVLDPCCGTGQFLLAFAEKIEDPEKIYGVDIDEIAVRIARINLLVKYKDKEFAPNIVCKNTLFEIGNYDLFSLNDEKIREFDVIATNPPWGVHFSKTDKERLKMLYPQIESFESFSYFLKKSIDLLKKDGVISFILPESILNVKVHSDIREIILNSTSIKKVFYLDRVFKNVFTPVIRLDIKKSNEKNNDVEIIKQQKKYNIPQMSWQKNNDFVFNIHSDNVDTKIIDKVYNIEHTTLLNNADWALGVVTGNNKKYVISENKEGAEPIFKGKDVQKLLLKEPTNYIVFTPDKFQQVAPVEKYRVKEKLVYKFISKNLVFAYDNKQRLTLNSANIVIPKIKDYPIKVIAGLFNSSLYQFIFQKKFSSIKVLRSHIEQLPLPLLEKNKYSEIVSLVNNVIKNKKDFEELDKYIYSLFKLTKKEIEHIIKFLK